MDYDDWKTRSPYDEPGNGDKPCKFFEQCGNWVWDDGTVDQTCNDCAKLIKESNDKEED